jgi:hypothetical protein
MKKLLIFIFILLNCSIYSQVNYPNAKQYLKEFIAIQSLLAENRTEDLKTFFITNGYIGVPGNENMFVKADLDGLINENDIFPGIYVKSGSNNVTYSDNFIEIVFIKKKQNSYEFKHSLEDCYFIKNIIQNLYEIGQWYTMLEAFVNYKKTNSVNVEKIDRYNYKAFSDEKPDDITYYRASNFFRAFADNKNKIDNVAFAGPGKILLTELMYEEPLKSDVEGKYFYKMRLASWKLEESESTEKFNVDFFMSLKNFNDRIWLDK